MMDLVTQLRIQARANRLANHRLHTAMAALPADEFNAPRTGFFPSLSLTLNHILAVDLYYIAALHGQTDMAMVWKRFEPCGTLVALAARQAASDERLIAFCESLNEASVAAVVDMDRITHVQRDLAGHVLAHVFMHQTHHRGQVHAMLCTTAVAPPQLDEFLMPSDAKFRQADMQALGWREDDVYG
jgi:uncharacterized damage-inducible protein DinB